MTDIVDRIETAPTAVERERPASSAPEPNPGLIGLPVIIPGAIGLGATNTGLIDVPAAAVPILVSATAIGLLITTIWAAAARQNVNATIYGTFFGFYGSYAALSIGLTHDWFGIDAADARAATTLWLASWLFTIGVLTVLVLRLPWIYPAVLAVVDVALVFLLIGNHTGDAGATRAGGWLVFVFAAVVVYFYVAALWEETGGRALPLGRPIIG